MGGRGENVQKGSEATDRLVSPTFAASVVLNIFSPYPAGPVGPGLLSSTQTLTGDIPTGSSWTVEVQDMNVPNPPQALLRHQGPIGPGQVIPGGLIGDPAFGTLTYPAFRFGAGQDGTVDYYVNIRSGSTGAVIDEARQTQFWDGSFYFRLAPQLVGQGGFTATDRQNLTLVKSAVYREEEADPAGILPVVSQIIDLVRGPPRSILHSGGSLPLQGRGVVSPLRDTSGKNAYGATWSWFTVPPGFGLIDGQLDEYRHRMAQFLIIREDGEDSLYIDELLDTNAEGGTITWKQPFPTEMRYDIAPGAVVIWRWLIAPF